MRVSNNQYALDVTVECREQPCDVTETLATSRKYTYRVPEDRNIKICIKNVGENINLTSLTKITTWELLKGGSFTTVYSQKKGENGIAFGNGHFGFELVFVH
jgi:hypothetical protein